MNRIEGKCNDSSDMNSEENIGRISKMMASLESLLNGQQNGASGFIVSLLQMEISLKKEKVHFSYIVI